MSESRDQAYTGGQPLNGKALQLDLGAEGRSLLDEARLAANGRAARTLVKERALRLTLLALKGGAGIPEHRANGPVSIHVIEGAVVIGVGDTSHALAVQQAVVIDADIVHSVVAQQESVILLTIAMAGLRAD